jgi:hypothetical protein
MLVWGRGIDKTTTFLQLQRQRSVRTRHRSGDSRIAIGFACLCLAIIKLGGCVRVKNRRIDTPGHYFVHVFRIGLVLVFLVID